MQIVLTLSSVYTLYSSRPMYFFYLSLMFACTALFSCNVVLHLPLIFALHKYTYNIIKYNMAGGIYTLNSAWILMTYNVVLFISRFYSCTTYKNVQYNKTQPGGCYTTLCMYISITDVKRNEHV